MTDHDSTGGALARISPDLTCPHCGTPLAPDGDGRVLRCGTRHTFDVARQGYVSLLPGDATPHTADSPAMVAARADFLGTGHYAPLTGALAAAVTAADPPPGLVVDVGAGTGHHLAAVLDALPGDRHGLALDISKHALRRAARIHPRVAAVVCDAWRPLPLRDGAAAVVLNVFAPRNGPELHRVLDPAGVLAVVTPTGAHLHELVGTLGLIGVDARKDERTDTKLGPWFTPVSRDEITFTMRLGHDDVATVVGMGPSARHLDPGTLAARIAALPDPVTVGAAVTVTRYRPATRA